MTSPGCPSSTIQPLSMNSTLVGDRLGELDFMRHDHHGDAVFREVAHDREHLAYEFGIERGGRFVEQDRLRIDRQRRGRSHCSPQERGAVYAATTVTLGPQLVSCRLGTGA